MALVRTEQGALGAHAHLVRDTDQLEGSRMLGADTKECLRVLGGRYLIGWWMPDELGGVMDQVLRRLGCYDLRLDIGQRGFLESDEVGTMCCLVLLDQLMHRDCLRCLRWLYLTGC